MTKKRFSASMYRFIKFMVRLFYPDTRVEGTENLPDEPCIIVGNHAKMNGPIACELYFPGDHYTWTAGEMMHLKEVPAYAYKDFWSGKPGYIRWFFRSMSYAVAPLSVCIFNNANCIGVYHDMRLVSTFRDTVSRLEQGANVVVFPEHDVMYNGLVWEFQKKFVDVASSYYRKTGRELCFVPMYVAPDLKTLYLGKPVRYDHSVPKKAQRASICSYLMEQITEMATALPEHTVVPYPNIPKKNYPNNKTAVREING